PVTGNNKVMEDSYGLYGLEGDGDFILYRDEVDMTLPTAESDTFRVVNSTPIYPNELKNDPNAIYVRGEPDTENFLSSDAGPAIYEFYGSARRMQNVTFEVDTTYPGEDQLMGTKDDGRSLLLGYEDIPFRIEQGEKPFILGDNFAFDAVLENDWNLATSLRVDDDLTADKIKATDEFAEGENDVAFEISKLADGVFADKISVLNADIGNEMSDLNDNLDHQKSIETLLLDQRRAVSSVSIDEEVSDLMQFQRSFQASSRVLNTLDKMLELVVLGLLK
ncbi:MAG: flagellar basal body rod C-terminal domain-containing protein, partial [Verrucomicrobiota bacterium]|nr:flagellar basal body rod C-terminal domain-containing protein [Verrucomicrobiota bacterium]